MRPAGWPEGLADPESDDFPARAVAWLLDQGPGEWRTVSLLREQPLLLAYLLTRDVDARLDGARAAYAQARRDLADLIDPVVLTELLSVLEAEGARLLSLQREAGLVEQALRGQRWRPRMS